MATQDPQEIWSSYYKCKKAERIAQAAQLWSQMQGGGVTPETNLELDFVHFGTLRANAEDLAKQLSENYKMEVVRNEVGDAWLVKGTTRPHAMGLGREQHMAWVEFMADVAESYGCVFSTWSLEAPSLGVRFNSAQIDDDPGAA
jgi:hypothetical protein